MAELSRHFPSYLGVGMEAGSGLGGLVPLPTPAHLSLGVVQMLLVARLWHSQASTADMLWPKGALGFCPESDSWETQHLISVSGRSEKCPPTGTWQHFQPLVLSTCINWTLPQYPLLFGFSTWCAEMLSIVFIAYHVFSTTGYLTPKMCCRNGDAKLQEAEQEKQDSETGTKTLQGIEACGRPLQNLSHVK